MAAMLEFVGVEKAYGTPERPTPALRGVSFTLAEGSLTSVIGPSGCGKTTLLNMAGLLDRPGAGEVRLNGAAVDFDRAEETARLRNTLIGFVFQAFHLLPRLTAWENVALPLYYARVPRPARKPLALDMLEQVGLADRVDHRPAELSGGQQQRVALARALVREARLILADEPTGSLDSHTAAEVMDLLVSLSRRLGVTVLMATHNPQLAARCDRRIEMLDGRLVGDSAET
ncbi:MAG TPA: ABC transporter ATP-binding protein [Caulobacteraceae bacterium]|nr:ABC transporter ATP-binding protein [Caulobacteraceae bacterium]